MEKEIKYFSVDSPFKIKDIIEKFTNLPFYSFRSIEKNSVGTDRWVICAQVVIGADMAEVYIREIELEIDTKDELKLISLMTTGGISYSYTYACNTFKPPIK